MTKYTITYPILGHISIEVDATNEEEALKKFFDKVADVKLQGVILDDPDTDYAWEFVPEINRGGVFLGQVQYMSIEES